MDTLHTLLGLALGASLIVNVAQDAVRRDMRAGAAYLRHALRVTQEDVLNISGRYHELRANSHRRDPKTGRLLPKGK